MKIERKWAMPNKWTFTIKPIKELLARYTIKDWIDPFAGYHSPANWTNDIDPDSPALFHYDALEFLKDLPNNLAFGALYDPPYSMRQATECYKSLGKENLTSTVTSMKYWSSCKDEIARIICPGGHAICCGWNSMGLGKSRGFEMIEILLVPHGGSRNDTIVTVEKKHE